MSVANSAKPRARVLMIITAALAACDVAAVLAAWELTSYFLFITVPMIGILTIFAAISQWAKSWTSREVTSLLLTFLLAWLVIGTLVFTMAHVT